MVNRYLKKQFIIALVYLAILLIIAGGIYFLILKPKLPSCNDGIQNQKEAGIDCGGPCALCAWQVQKPINIIFVQAIETRENYADLAAKIQNPNSDFGAKSFSFEFNLYDSQNNLITSESGASYILPQETKYIIKQKILVNSDISKIEFKIKNISWQKLVDYSEPEFLIRGEGFQQKGDISKAVGTLVNRSNYDFDKIDILAILLDENSQILGAGQIELKTILSKESRYFEIGWFYPLGQVKKIDIVAKTNVFLDENFMKRHGGEREKFQEY